MGLSTFFSPTHLVTLIMPTKKEREPSFFFLLRKLILNDSMMSISMELGDSSPAHKKNAVHFGRNQGDQIELIFAYV
jgi:hypothetical protein